MQTKLMALAVGFVAFGASSSAAAQDAGAQAPVATDASEPRVVDLTTFIAATRQSYPGLRASGHKIEAARARLAEATYSPFFQFTANAALGIAPETNGSPIFSRDSQLPISNAWQPLVQVGVEGAVPLWTFGKLSSLRSAAGAGVTAAEKEKEVSLDAVIFDVRRAYYGLELALDTRQMLDEGQGKLETAERKLHEMIEEDNPDVNPMDEYRLSSALAEIRARRAEAEMLEQSTRDALATLSGISSFELPDCPLSAVPYEPKPVAEYVTMASEDRPEFSMLKAGMRARRAASDIAAAYFLPDIALGIAASYSYAPGITNQSNPFITDRANFQSIAFGLVARWSLDFVGTWHRTARADAELAQTSAQVDEARRGIALQVSTTHHEVTEARARQAAWGEGHKKSRAWFVAAAQGYQVGAVETKELIDAVKSYFTARFSLLQATMDWNVALAKLEKNTGSELLPTEKWEVSCDE